MRNVEIKAVIRNFASTLEIAKKLSVSEGVLIHQHDIFYNVRQGRLKLRQFENGNAELIYYERPDTEGPKLSDYEKTDIPSSSVPSLKAVLERALGIKGEVLKDRYFFMIGHTRVHVDKVHNLGDFLELEVVLKPEQNLEEGQAIANALMQNLGIKTEDLLAGAYLDMLNK